MKEVLFAFYHLRTYFSVSLWDYIKIFYGSIMYKITDNPNYLVGVYV